MATSAQKVTILGAGMVGSVMAADLVKDEALHVTIADRSEASLERARQRAPGVHSTVADLGEAGVVGQLAAQSDLVLGAMPSAIAFGALGAVIESGRPYCDISFMPEDAMDLDESARQRGVTAVVDCGVAPGMSNMFVGHAAAQLDTVERVRICVGGLPRVREKPFEYKAGFAPYDVIQEYTRPSRIVENGQVVLREALTDVEEFDVPGVGRVEAFVTDGLRSLVHTIQADHLVEKTIRYPGHADLMRVFRDTGLFSFEAIPAGVNGAMVRPFDVTAALLFPKWTYKPGEEDLTVMLITVEGMKGAERLGHRLTLVDYYDRASQCTSMSRTTALPCTIVARLIADGAFDRPGVNPPELVGRQAGLFKQVLSELENRGVHYELSVEPIT